MASSFNKIVIEVIEAVTQTWEWRGAQTIIITKFKGFRNLESLRKVSLIRNNTLV